MKMKKQFLTALALLSFTAQAAFVPRKCVSKLLQIAGNTATSGLFFDWTDAISEQFNIYSVPILKRSCVSSDAKLHSFRLVLRGYDKETNSVDEGSNVMSDSAGPAEVGECYNERSPVYAQPMAGRIYYDNERVQGVRFFYKEKNEYF